MRVMTEELWEETESVDLEEDDDDAVSLAFEEGERRANDEMTDSWNAEDAD
ncbi:hypothetical protein J4219_09160 [Candidatus Woesearchaeota archaeon]|nr:hypothetical protein [Candidatus Woesearchaeota archaeon]